MVEWMFTLQVPWTGKTHRLRSAILCNDFSFSKKREPNEVHGAAFCFYRHKMQSFLSLSSRLYALQFICPCRRFICSDMNQNQTWWAKRVQTDHKMVVNTKYQINPCVLNKHYTVISDGILEVVHRAVWHMVFLTTDPFAYKIYKKHVHFSRPAWNLIWFSLKYFLAVANSSRPLEMNEKKITSPKFCYANYLVLIYGHSQWYSNYDFYHKC